MGFLNDVPEIDQRRFEVLLDFNIRNKLHTVIFGPSGGGKTAIGNQMANKNNAILHYCNLAVNERPDIQGWPIMSSSGIAEFATPHYIPLPETVNLEEKKSLNFIQQWIKCNQLTQYNVTSAINNRLVEISRYEDAIAAAKAIPYIINLEFENKDKFIDDIKKAEELAKQNMRKVVVLFDEADKTPHDVLQPLLEILQFGTLNGKALCIDSCILTCNLPDEKAFTENLSHALTSRCFVYKMKLDYNIWAKWARKNNVHPLVIGFTGHSDYFYKAPTDDKIGRAHV
jgi:hypothetical protein